MTKKFILSQEDNTVEGGNKRGNFAVDLQMERNVNSQVASGANSVVLGGRRNTASGTDSIAGGLQCTAIGVSAVALGNQVSAGGTQSFCLSSEGNSSGSQSVSIGRQTKSSGGQSMALGLHLIQTENHTLTFMAVVVKVIMTVKIYSLIPVDKLEKPM